MSDFNGKREEELKNNRFLNHTQEEQMDRGQSKDSDSQEVSLIEMNKRVGLIERDMKAAEKQRIAAKKGAGGDLAFPCRDQSKSRSTWSGSG